MSLAQQRDTAVRQTLAAIRAIAAQDGITHASLARIAERLQELAAQEALFPLEAFPPPPSGDADAASRYLLHQEADQRFALYLNAINPGKTTPPHNHTTWAVIVALEGEELNRVYTRADDGSDPDRATLALSREVVVRPGTPITFLDDDIHSIHVVGDRPTRHFHLYGRALETLTGRIGFDLGTGRILNYNRNYMRPTKQAT
ncbi:cysteine dioxygenase family protein [Ralstonia solanacearum]|uniref:cysteine dioxygenase family protein n=1 Tax=Ralstonia solanacearum TaxID=305 RepID=UPI000447EB7A|nr:cysteine dioxygenase family protein [Ralstonia solanacearum]EUJ12521.1 cysteine dioxygenase [Ralstonia solanacearum P673]MCL9843873.1 cysteine dioxygenase family protein [Ralstonia solanacearum]MCL9851925.1 cysteine dioxygenase family protein [Ralstonia solanacearum]MCL9853926.1 cysteine dioxygenase family protein [Ralstonia solanacearum]MCL9860701.1 cysteine dioxygenase family protein [Ralstonia solanacearum]